MTTTILDQSRAIERTRKSGRWLYVLHPYDLAEYHAAYSTDGKAWVFYCDSKYRPGVDRIANAIRGNIGIETKDRAASEKAHEPIHKAAQLSNSVVGVARNGKKDRRLCFRSGRVGRVRRRRVLHESGGLLLCRSAATPVSLARSSISAACKGVTLRPARSGSGASNKFQRR